MKKTALFAVTFVFAAAFGVAYAGEGNKVISNGITDFTGRSYDEVPVFSSVGSSAMLSDSIESTNAGGLRSADLGIETMNNGITDFTDRSYDTVPDFGPAVSSGKLHSTVKSAARLPEAVYDPGKPLTD